MTLEKLLADYCRKKYFGEDKQPIKIGVYRPSVLAWSCVRRQYNYYALFNEKKPEEIPDKIVLLLAGGVVFHRLVQSLKDETGKSYWDKTEVECSLEVDIAGDKIIIVGRADAIRGSGIDEEVWEFKHTRTIPLKPLFPHQLQLNFYLAALKRVKGVLLYTGYDADGGLAVKEFPCRYSEWHLEHLISRAQMLHTFLAVGIPPRCSCRDHRHEGGNL